MKIRIMIFYTLQWWLQETKLKNLQQNIKEHLIILSHEHENGELNSMKQNQRTLISPNKQIEERTILLNGLRIKPANTQRSTSEWHLMLSYDGKPTSRWKKRNCNTNFEKCSGCSEDPICHYPISYYFINKYCDQYGHMVSNYGDVRKNHILSWSNTIKIEY